jgi:predicted DNA repair protein MutK
MLSATARAGLDLYQRFTCYHPHMAGTNLLTLIDDIATLLDDVAAMSKVAVKKTAGVLGDDLALNAQQVTGVYADRELPVVWAVAKGSLKNKLILVPAALLISAFLPWAITPLLMLGGAFLCYEGFEKLAHRFLYSQQEDKNHHAEQLRAMNNPAVDMLAFEKDKIRGAIRTDFILSAEIIVITLGTVASVSFGKQVVVLCTIALAMTLGVYGLVAGIVKLDDAGLWLTQREGSAWSNLQNALGRAIVVTAPWLMKTLSVLGTAAMFLVGGSIVLHGLPALHSWVQPLVPVSGWALNTLLEGLAGVLTGALVFSGLCIFQKTKKMIGFI